MTYKYKKRCRNSLVTREMLFQTIRSYITHEILVTLSANLIIIIMAYTCYVFAAVHGTLYLLTHPSNPLRNLLLGYENHLPF